MKKKSIFCLVIFCIMLFSMTLVRANFVSYAAPVIHVEVNNIEDDIKNITLVTSDNNCNIVDAYKGSNMDFSKASFLDNNGFNYCAIFNDEVNPYEKEDYVFNENYDKKNYLVKLEISYSYSFPNGNSFSNGSIGKLNNAEDLIKYHSINSEDEKEYIRSGNFTCKRDVFYIAEKLIKEKDISTSDIKNKKLVLNIDNIENKNIAYCIRFEKQNGEFVTLKIGDNLIMKDSLIGYNVKIKNLKKNVVINYKTKTRQANDSLSKDDAKELAKFNFPKVTWNNASSWAEVELINANENELIPEIFEKKDLTKNITRKEFAHIAVRLYEILSDKEYDQKLNNPFNDTNDEEIVKAYSIGITQGTSEVTFGPNKLITREQMATMMTRALEKLGIYTDINISKTKLFSDDSQINEWGRQAIYYMAKNNIIKGVGENTFAPSDSATIEQAILISKRCKENYGDLKEVSKKETTPEDVGTINLNYTANYKNASELYNGENGKGNVDSNDVKEIQVFLDNGFWGDSIYYYSNKKEDIDYINNDVTEDSDYTEDTGYVTFVLKNNTIVHQNKNIDANKEDFIRKNFKKKNIVLSNTARLDKYYECLDYTEEEHSEIIRCLTEIQPIGTSIDDTSIEGDVIRAYQYENKSQVTYTYRVADSKELVSILDDINSRRATKLFGIGYMTREVEVTKQQNGVVKKLKIDSNMETKTINGILNYVKNHYKEAYPSDNYYQIKFLGDNSFFYVKIPINSENNAFFQSL